ncbi:MBL fold metallo-hydrolase RNA specificity domain-containing protein [Sulfurovum sp. NBC37-1]|uniref:MBL fold metallo-hydrolase RNA specificity domain-containing protein n=1 Tax=Sulfurovum sp. (strain NBC37-1) TaxID=387093 RepID=UPI0001587C63|nr:MBL fold metallo-hydrolase [Sulfurovum sp. NBC37-1]BAF73122.1 RNA-metabolising metallo-beta-lactamase [Sulfurovum sp. NBC37-1]
MATVVSYGAAEVVTGSCHLFTIDGGPQILVDCGMFQGQEEERNYGPFDFNPSEVDYLLVTHAHLDHVGRIPKLVKEGFTGKIYATHATHDLAEIILLDSAKIMKEDFNTKYKKAQRQGKEEGVMEPLYAEADVEDVFEFGWHYPEYDKSFTLEDGIEITYRDAGHILGAAFIEIRYKENGVDHTIVFSGDIGNDTEIVMKDLAPCTHADYLYVESTYGDRDHQGVEDTVTEFKSVIIKTMKDWGNVIIPSFAVERTQELLCILKQMHRRKELPQCKIFVDSPMATRATEVYRNYSELLSSECQEIKKEDGTIFDFENLVYTLDVEASKAINDMDTRAIIIAGSGMCNGGRILHHFKNRLWNKKNAVIFVGYQAVGTLGRHIVDGARWVKIYNEDILIKASIHTINGFSAHADQKGIVKWISQIEDLKRIYLVHGEEDKEVILRSVLENELHAKAHIVEPEEVIYLA